MRAALGGMPGLARQAASSAKRAWAPARAFASPGFGMLEQLPDFLAGHEAMKQGHLAAALMPMKRASEVAAAYFPAEAFREKALAHAASGRCLWYAGLFSDAAGEFEAGLRAAGSQVPAAVAARLAEAAARSHFEAGHFDFCAKLVAEAAAAAPTAPGPKLIEEALRVVEGGTVAGGGLPGAPDRDLEAVRRTNRLVGEALPEPGAGSVPEALEAELGEGGPLANFLKGPPSPAGLMGPPGSASWLMAPSLTLMALRSTAGQLAVEAGLGGRPWARPLLVAALNDYEALKPGGPTMGPLLFRTLGALGTLTGRAHDAIAAEGLFRSAVDHAEEAMRGPWAAGLDVGRGRLWRAAVFGGYAELLESGRQAEQRATEIQSLRERAAAALHAEQPPPPTQSQRRWALVYLPPPQELSAEEIFG